MTTRRQLSLLKKVAAGAILLQPLEACTNQALLGNSLSGLNPCFILNCDPDTYRNLVFILTSGFDPNEEFCSLPGYCTPTGTPNPAFTPLL